MKRRSAHNTISYSDYYFQLKSKHYLFVSGHDKKIFFAMNCNLSNKFQRHNTELCLLDTINSFLVSLYYMLGYIEDFVMIHH